MKSYLIDPVQLVSTNEGLIRAERIQPETLIKNLQGVQKIIEVNKVEKLVKQVSFKNGWVTYLDLKSNVQQEEKLIPVSQIKEGDFLNFCFFNYFNLEKKTPINWQDKKMAVPIRIPKYLTLDFAYWIGIVSAQSKSSVGHRHIQIEIKKDGPLKDVFTALTKRIFNLTVDEVTEGNRKFLQINSSNLVKFLQHNIGRRLMVFRKVPVFIQEADIAYQMAYIRGLSVKGHLDQTKYVIYSGSSKTISEFVASFLTSIGYGVYRKIKKLGNKKVYNVLISYCHRDTVRINSEFLVGINHKDENKEFNPEFKQSYLISSKGVINDLENSKTKLKEIRGDYSWKLKLLKEEHRLELNKFKKSLKKMKQANKDQFVSSVDQLKRDHKLELNALLAESKRLIDVYKVTMNPGYKSIKKAQERNQSFLMADSLNDPMSLTDVEYLVKVKEVKILKKEMIELVVSSDSGIIIEGLIIQ